MAVKATDSGKWTVDVKQKDRPRFRHTFASYEAAHEAQRQYLAGIDKPAQRTHAASAVITLRDLYDNAMVLEWGSGAVKGPQAVARWILDNYWGWDRDHKSITGKDITQFMKWLAEQGNSDSTINRKLAALSGMYRYGIRQQIIEYRPRITQKKIKNNRRLRFLDAAEELALLRYVRDVRGAEWSRFLIFLIETGCRVSEAVRMTWDDVDRTQRQLHVTKSKTGRERFVPITQRLLDLLYTMNADGNREGPLFPGVTPNRLNKVVWPGVREHFNDDDPHFVPHCLRHTRATRLIQAGVDIETTRQWMGHTNVATTMRYVQFRQREAFKSALEKVDG